MAIQTDETGRDGAVGGADGCRVGILGIAGVVHEEQELGCARDREIFRCRVKVGGKSLRRSNVQFGAVTAHDGRNALRTGEHREVERPRYRVVHGGGGDVHDLRLIGRQRQLAGTEPGQHPGRSGGIEVEGIRRGSRVGDRHLERIAGNPG